jgi:hypothetical protein
VTISAAATATATASPRLREILVQHRICHVYRHRNIACDRPPAWFGQIRIIFLEIAPFLVCEFCYMAAIKTGRRADGNLVNVRFFMVICKRFIHLHH